MRKGMLLVAVIASLVGGRAWAAPSLDELKGLEAKKCISYAADRLPRRAEIVGSDALFHSDDKKSMPRTHMRWYTGRLGAVVGDQKMGYEFQCAILVLGPNGGPVFPEMFVMKLVQ